jgi:hypothetical protein
MERNMITLDPFLYDYQLYELLPKEHRWIMNKLMVAEAMGHYCGPSGVHIKKPGAYCIRPMMNLFGMAHGGIQKFETDGDIQPEHPPGRFWCEWFDGHFAATEFIDDKPVRQIGGDIVDNVVHQPEEEITMEMPDMFKGISRYMLIEHIGGKIIEVSPRHMNQCAHPQTVEDYKQFDPDYDPTQKEVFRYGGFSMRLVGNLETGAEWEEI